MLGVKVAGRFAMACEVRTCFRGDLSLWPFSSVPSGARRRLRLRIRTYYAVVSAVSRVACLEVGMGDVRSDFCLEAYRQRLSLIETMFAKEAKIR